GEYRGVRIIGINCPKFLGPLTPSQQDQDWLVAAHQGNLAEIAAGEAAVEMATTEAVRTHGQMLIDDHKKLDADLMAVAEELGVTLPSMPTEEQQATLKSVSAQSGEAFDMAWVESQITAHRHTLSMGEEELAQGTEQAVMDLADTAAPVVQKHLDTLMDTAQDLGVPTSVPAGTGGQAATSPHALGFALVGTGLAGIIVAGLFLVRRRQA
ncbi:DUF4142 domain-containing protein, partial [Promicromonospora umidemergens]